MGSPQDGRGHRRRIAGPADQLLAFYPAEGEQIATAATYRHLMPIVFASGPIFTGTDREPAWVEIEGASTTRVGNGSRPYRAVFRPRGPIPLLRWLLP